MTDAQIKSEKSTSQKAGDTFSGNSNENDVSTRSLIPVLISLADTLDIPSAIHARQDQERPWYG